jgi:uncharacterized protein (DUF1697 family)
MEDLRKAFAALGFTNIRTVLASGNVIFDASNAKMPSLVSQIEKKVQSSFGFDIIVIVRAAREIQALLESEPFKTIKVRAPRREHVSFLGEDPQKGFAVSQRIKGPGYETVRVSAGEICSAVEVSDHFGTTDLMKLLEKEFGKKITTRTWNTVERIAAGW